MKFQNCIIPSSIAGVFLIFKLLFASSVHEFTGYDDFLQSTEIRNLSITADGKVQLGPQLSLVYNTKESYVWSLAQDKKGNIFAGTGSDGKIFRISPLEADKGELFFDSEETEILSIALDQQGNLYAGTAPKGVVYKISPPKADRAEKFFETNENYVFALVFDEKGFLYIGTGEKGNIYKVNAQGNGKVIYDSPEPHITSLVFSSKPKPTLFAGTSGQGLVYKITELESNPEIMTIYDATEEEIRALFIDGKGDIYCGANPSYPKSGVQKSDFSEITLSASGLAQAGKSSGFIPKIYQLSSDGLVKQSWQSSDSVIFAIQAYGKEIMIGTGNSGRIYLVDKQGIGKGLGTLSLTTSEPQITVLSSGPSGSILIGTGNPGKIYRLKSDMNK